jgi:hypothetical protein
VRRERVRRKLREEGKSRDGWRKSWRGYERRRKKENGSGCGVWKKENGSGCGVLKGRKQHARPQQWRHNWRDGERRKRGNANMLLCFSKREKLSGCASRSVGEKSKRPA